MQKFIALAAVAASALLVSSANASDLGRSQAVPTVRIAIAGKSVGEVRNEIRVAAQTVCRTGGYGCVDQAVADAERQFDALRHAADAQPRQEQARQEPMTVRVAVAGKTRDQLLQEIDAAARTVCQPMADSTIDYRACVDQAVTSAHEQMRHLTVAAAGVEQLAQN